MSSPGLPDITPGLDLARSILDRHFPTSQGYTIKTTGPLMNRVATLPNGVELLPSQTRGFMVERLEPHPSRPSEGPKGICRAVLSYANTGIANMPIFTAGVQQSLEKLDSVGVLADTTQVMILLGTKLESFQYREETPISAVTGQETRRAGSHRATKRLYPMVG